MTRVLVVDDHAVVRRGLIALIREQIGQVEIGEASTADEAVGQVMRGIWDIVVLDITMPGRSGLDALTDIKAQRPQLPVLVLSMHPEDQMAMRVLRAGASGYLTKDSAPEELVNAVRRILSGRRYVSESMADRLVMDLQSNDVDEPVHEKLSNREFEVLRMLAAGTTITEIAQALSLSVKTVSTYHTRLLEKMGLRTDSALIQYAVRHHLVE